MRVMTDADFEQMRADYARAWEADQAENARDQEKRNAEILALATEQIRWRDGELEMGDANDAPGCMVSEGDDNGAYVRAWVWVDFSGTRLDKETEDEEATA